MEQVQLAACHAFKACIGQFVLGSPPLGASFGLVGAFHVRNDGSNRRAHDFWNKIESHVAGIDDEQPDFVHGGKVRR